MIVASFGGGVNSTAMLIGMVERQEKCDLILFADTGGEKPHTYEHIKKFSRWLEFVGLPEIITVKREPHGRVRTLEQDCLDAQMLPSIAYGYKACSMKYKRDPQDKYCNNDIACMRAWQKDGRITKLIGYDADEQHRAHIKEDDKYAYRFPLVEWGWGRQECIEAIQRAGQSVPDKSACFFCPSSKKSEIMELRRIYPKLAERAVAMERNAIEGNLITCSLCSGSGFVNEKVTGTIESINDHGDDVLEPIITKLDAPEQCHTCLGTGTILRGVMGLGRNFAWGDLYEADDRQVKLFPESPIEQACMCYDGESEHA